MLKELFIKILKGLLYPVAGGLAMVGLVFGLILLSSGNEPTEITAQVIEVNTQNTIAMPHSYQPLPKGPEGSIVLNIKPPVGIFEQFKDSRDYILFFSATEGPRIEVLYNIHTKRFSAGEPELTSPVLDIFDGGTHMLAYTYKENDMQRLYFDGALVSESVYEPSRSMITGMVISDNKQFDIFEGIEMQVTVLNNVYTP